MKTLLYFWRLGWVAFITLFLCGVGINLLGKGAIYLAGLNATEDMTSQFMIVSPVFLIIGLPFAGWVFSLGMKKANVLVKPNKESNV